MIKESAKVNKIESAALDAKEKHCTWDFESRESDMVTLTLKHVISKICWHPKGDYFSTMAHNLQATSQVLIHSVSKATTQKPFSTTKGIIQAFAFHPTKPHFFACTHMTVFQYNLQK